MANKKGKEKGKTDSQIERRNSYMADREKEKMGQTEEN